MTRIQLISEQVSRLLYYIEKRKWYKVCAFVSLILLLTLIVDIKTFGYSPKILGYTWLISSYTFYPLMLLSFMMLLENKVTLIIEPLVITVLWISSIWFIASSYFYIEQGRNLLWYEIRFYFFESGYRDYMLDLLFSQRLVIFTLLFVGGYLGLRFLYKNYVKPKALFFFTIQTMAAVMILGVAESQSTIFGHGMLNYYYEPASSPWSIAHKPYADDETRAFDFDVAREIRETEESPFWADGPDETLAPLVGRYQGRFVIVVLLLWVIRHRVGRGPVVGVLFFCGTLFPALGFFDVYPFRYSYVADHFQYLASVGFIVLLVGMFTKVISMLREWSPRIATPLGLMVLLLLGWQTWSQGYVYRNIESLWVDTIRKNPMSWVAHNNLGVALANQDRLEEAIAHYQEALRLDPTLAVGHNNLGDALVKQGKAEEAISQYLAALRLNRNLHKTWVNLDEVIERQEEREKLIIPETESLATPSEYARSLSNLGVAMALLGKCDQATGYYRKALELQPQWSEGHNNLGNALAAQGKFNEAVHHLSRALELKPDYADAHNNLAVVYARLGKFVEASAQYREALHLKPHSAEIHNNLGAALAAQGKLEEAIEHYNRALELKPKYAEAQMNLGNALSYQGDLRRGTVHLRGAVTIDSNSPEIHNNLGVALARQGKLEEAIVHFTEALRLRPSYGQAQLKLQLDLEQRENARTN